MNGHVSPTARLLGFAGLLPQAALAALQLFRPDEGWRLLAFAYAALILSFLGGIWWGFAVRRSAHRAPLLLAAVMPSLAAFALLVAALLTLDPAWPLVLLGAALFLTLPVDRHLAAIGEAPTGWMRLRVPLSLGLGALTVLMGLV